MKYLKALPFIVLMSLSSCGGGSSSGKKVTQEEFENTAKEWVSAYKNGEKQFTKAVMSGSYSQSYDKTKETLKIEYELTMNNTWQINNEVGSSSTLEGYSGYIDCTMDNYSSILNGLYFVNTVNYYLSSSSASIKGSTTGDGSQYMNDKVTIVWNQYGLLQSYKSVGKVSIPFFGSSTTTIALEFKYE